MVIWIIFFKDIKVEEVALLQLQYETWNSTQYHHLRSDYNADTCLSRSPHVCDLWEPGYSNLQYDDEGRGRFWLVQHKQLLQ